MKIIIETEKLNLTEQQIKHLFADALYEFVSHRGPTTEEYVNRRYPNTPNYAWLNRKKKIAEVNSRIIAANSLHNAVLKLKIEFD